MGRGATGFANRASFVVLLASRMLKDPARLQITDSDYSHFHTQIRGNKPYILAGLCRLHATDPPTIQQQHIPQI